jgi:hypothetical protein
MKQKQKQWRLRENLHQVSLFCLCTLSALHDFTPLDPMPSQFLRPWPGHPQNRLVNLIVPHLVAWG